ncbi:MAG TPA: glycosyltransferase [Mycobacteriales bacterium]|nr:glycosyltransferase [Mycobacteriales bacterium]
MTVVSVVVPIYNVAPYLEACLASIAAQTHTELDVVLVDDGSTDDSAEIAARFADSDPRFRLVRQPNGGLGNARNAGVAHARGEMLAFVDSDDLLPPRAYEHLLRALEQSSSDFATGAFRRLDETGSRPAYYAAAAFARRRSAEHITRFHDLVVDRTAWNKLFRRSFWDVHGFRFGAGVQYEDQYATLPAYFLAGSVEVLATPVYYWRLRGESITHGREQPRSIADRLTAIGWTRSWLTEHGFAEHLDWYDASVFAQDLGYVPETIAAAGEPERELLLDRIDAVLGDSVAYLQLPAIDRLSWELVRRRDLPRLRELVQVKTSGAAATARPRRRLRHWQADYPFRRDGVLPRSLYRVDGEMEAVSHLARIAVDGRTVRLEGLAYLAHLGAREPRGQRLAVWATCGEHRVDFEVRQLRRPDLATVTPSRAADVTGAGFVAVVAADRFRLPSVPGAEAGGNASGPVEWQVSVGVRSRGVRAATAVHQVCPAAPVTGATVVLGRRRQARVELTSAGELIVHVEPRAAELTGVTMTADGLELTGNAPGGSATHGLFRLSATGEKRAGWPVELAADDGRRTFTARLPLAELRSDLDLPTAPQTLRRQRLEQWDLAVKAGKLSARLRLPCVPDDTWTVGDREWLLGTTRAGWALLVERLPRPIVTGVSVTAAGFELTGRRHHDDPGAPLLLAGADADLPVPVDGDAASGGFRVVLTPDDVDRAEGTWDLVVRRPDDPGPPVPCAFAESVLAALPLLVTTSSRRMVLGVRGRTTPTLTVRAAR